MENFVIDLDKVLDEFEKSEDTKAKELSGTQQAFFSHFCGNALMNVKLPGSNFYHSGLGESNEKIDLADADFSASSSSLAAVSQSNSEKVSQKPARESVGRYTAANVSVEEKIVSVEAPSKSLRDVELPSGLSCNGNVVSSLSGLEVPPSEKEENEIDSQDLLGSGDTSSRPECESVEQSAATVTVSSSTEADEVENKLPCTISEATSVEDNAGSKTPDVQSRDEPLEAVTRLIVGFATVDDRDISNADVDMYLEDLEVDEPTLESFSETTSEDRNEAPTNVPAISEMAEDHMCLVDLDNVEKIGDAPGSDGFAATECLLNVDEPQAIENELQNVPANGVPAETPIDGIEESSGDGHRDRLARPNSLDLSTRNDEEQDTGSETLSNGEPDIREPNLLDFLDDGQAPVLSEEEQLLGKLRPFWIPDMDAPACMHCEAKFSFIKRRHHCRACGKVLCGQCCNGKAKLDYLDNRESRVCCRCLVVLVKAKAIQRLWGGSPTDETPSEADGSPELGSPNPNNPQEYCSTISPLQQIQNGQQTGQQSSPPTVMVPVGVLKRDGIRPGGDLSDPDAVAELPCKRPSRVQRRVERGSPVAVLHSPQRSSGSRKIRRRALLSDAEGPFPPMLLPLEYTLTDQPDSGHLMEWLQDDDAPPVAFALTKNLHVLVKIQKLDCCMDRECWCFTSRGMCTVGQDEFMVILERLPDENTLPRDVFYIFSTVYDNASKGNTVSEMGNVLFPEGVLGSREHSGFLFVRPTLQCVEQLHLPPAPYLVALLIQKWEIPWAKVFPLRLLLRIGSEFRYYPCPLVSVRFRKPVFGEIGHTIMSVLADFRNYHYTLPVVPGMEITMAERKTTVSFPRGRYNQVVRTVTNSNEHVLGFGGNFSATADSHLVCLQTEDGNYQTQAINIQNTSRKVTGASFIVFSGALKSSTGLTGKSSMVEDGLLIQIPNDSMASLKAALRDMRDYDVVCGPVGVPEADEVVSLRWCDDDNSCNRGVKSVIDGRSLEGVDSVRVHAGTDYAADRHLIRWTEVFFLSAECANERRIEASKIAEAVAQACCLALTSYLEILSDAEMTKIGLRVTADADKVGYEVGSREEQLNGACMSDLDSSLIPVITGISTTGLEGAIFLELIFHVLLK